MPRGLSLLIYGIEGIGKTSFSLQFPKPLNIAPIREPGFFNLEMVGEVPTGVTPLILKNYEDLKIAVEACQAKTLVLDSLSGFQEYLTKYVVNEYYDGSNKKFEAFYNGLRQTCPKVISELIDLLEFKVNQGTNVIILGHRQTDVDPDAGGPDTKIQTIFGDIGVTGPFVKWAQAILFMSGKKNVDVVTKSSGYGDNTKVLEGKAASSVTRLMYTSFSGNHIAKNLLHLPPVISMGKSAEESYNNFVNALPPKIQEVLKK
jgi:hypothetical protein